MSTISINPRPAIKQGIDPNHPIVVQHTNVYNSITAQIGPPGSTPIFKLDPYGTAPLSGVLGVFLVNTEPVRVQISDNKDSLPIDYMYTSPNTAQVLIPIIGFAPDAISKITVSGTGMLPFTLENIVTSPLPPSDLQIPSDGTTSFTGFPLYEVTSPAMVIPPTVDELFFSAYYNRYNTGIDITGSVRWYTTREMPAFNYIRLANGNFFGSANNVNENHWIYEFDIVGRVYTVYVLDTQSHHTIYEMTDGDFLIASGTDGAVDNAFFAGLSIISRETGIEKAYYDLRQVLDLSRQPRPGVAGDVDWFHLNKCLHNVPKNILIASGRHQCVCGIKKDTGDLVFILGNRDSWAIEYQQYLLQPVDNLGVPLYDFNNPEDIDLADKEFWPWAQHAVVDIPNDNPDIIEFILFNNGNYRSRDDAKSLLPNDNYSHLVRYKIHLNSMTVEKTYEYGQTQIGNRGYSSYVGSVSINANGNYLINCGAATVDENGRMLTEYPGRTDIVDPIAGNEAMAKHILHEVDPSTNQTVVEFMITTGRYKNSENDGNDYVHDLISYQMFKDCIVR